MPIHTRCTPFCGAIRAYGIHYSAISAYLPSVYPQVLSFVVVVVVVVVVVIGECTSLHLIAINPL